MSYGQAMSQSLGNQCIERDRLRKHTGTLMKFCQSEKECVAVLVELYHRRHRKGTAYSRIVDTPGPPFIPLNVKGPPDYILFCDSVKDSMDCTGLVSFPSKMNLSAFFLIGLTQNWAENEINMLLTLTEAPTIHFYE